MRKSGMDYLSYGFRNLFTKGIKWYVLVPLVINTVLFFFLWWLALHEVSHLIAWVDQILPTWLTWMSYIFYLIAIIGMFFVTIYFYTTLAVIIASPFYSLISQKIQLKNNLPIQNANNFKSWALLVPRTIIREIRKILMFMPWALLILICVFIPVLNLFTSIMWFVLVVFYNMVLFTDYPFDNNEKSLSNLKRFIRNHKSTVWTLGLVTTIALMIPIVNIFAIPAAVIGATKLYSDYYGSANIAS